MKTTSHKKTAFNIEEWCDFVRGLAPAAAQAAMESELAVSSAAREAVARFERVLAVAEQDAHDEVPAYALRVVKAVAGLRPHHRESILDRALRRLPFELTFDSLLHATAAGTRDMQSSHQHLSFVAADYCVDVRLEQETNPHSQVVVGQLLRRLDQPEPVPDVPVLMLAGDRVVGRSRTSRFGEFQIADLPPDPLGLCFLVGSEEYIEVPLGISDSHSSIRRRQSRVHPGAVEPSEDP